MPYRYISFANLTLPIPNPVEPYDTDGWIGEPIALLGGGVFWPYGSGRAPRGDRVVARQGLMIEATAAALLGDYDALASYMGLKNVLRRQNDTEQQTQWVHAVLGLKPEDRDPFKIFRWRNVLALAVTTEFRILSPSWHGLYHGASPGVILDGVGLDTGDGLDFVPSTVTLDAAHVAPNTFTITNGGDCDVEDIVFSVVAGSAPITAITVTNVTTGYAWTWTGSVPSGQTLTVDTAWAVNVNGVNAFSGISWTRAKWFVLQPGANTVRVNLTGGGVTSTFTPAYWDRWL